MKDENNETSTPTLSKVRKVNLSQFQPELKSGNKLLNEDYSIISDIKLDLEAMIGTAELTVKELFDLQAGSIVELDQSLETFLTLRFDGKPIALGSLVVVGDNFGIQIAEIIDRASNKI